MRLTLRIIFSLIVFLIFSLISSLVCSLLDRFSILVMDNTVVSIVSVVVGIIIGLIFYLFLSSFAVKKVVDQLSQVEDILVKMNIKELAVSTTGCVIGLIIANLIGLAVRSLGLLGTIIVILLNILLGYLGFSIGKRKREEISAIFEKKDVVKSSGKPKILDTSVIIDGRILDLLQTGFIEGKIIIPDFVLEELRHIADSSDGLKRNRGRRGLDILNEIQKQLTVTVEIIDWNWKDKANASLEVDSKLLKMAQEMDAYVVTNDYNLNKVAEFQGVFVLNINELANAIKPVVLPGEDMAVTIIKDGKENGQGIGYLNDGTMIVVEGGRRHIGDTVNVLVTSVLQTAAGRMIFTKLKA